jgi:glyoxylase-like metal-dependent hydrolase (beta-lactamase superfamily II)
VERIAYGTTSVTAVLDRETAWVIDEMFAEGATPGDRATMASRMPGEYDDEHWLIRCRAYLVRTAATTILVDAGSGPAGAIFSEGRAGRLPEILASLGVAPADVDHVVLTHTHSDHFGWCTAPGPGGWTPYFTNARYHLHPADIAMIRASATERGAQVAEMLLDPLERSGQLSLVPEDHDVALGVRLRHAPGHTPGHRVVGVDTGAHQLVLTGDLLHTSYQVAHPEFDFGSDTDPAQAAATRAELLAEIDARGNVLGAAHLPMAFARLTSGELVGL